MANGAFNFKNNSGNIVSFISGSDSNIIMSGGTLDLSSMTGITLGNLTLSGTSENATSASHAASYLLTSSFNTYSGTTDTVIGTLQTSTGSLNSFSSSTNNSLSSIETSTSSLNSFTSSATTRLSSIETTTGSLNSYTSSNNTRLGVIESTTGSLNSYTSSNTTNINAIHTSTSSLNSFSSSATTRLSSIEGVSGSYATTGSNQFKNDQVITGSLIVTGFIETQELRTTYISSSILFRSGSTKFGDELSDTHAFTGSLLVSGTISVPDSNLVSGSSQVLNGSGVFSGSAQLPSGIVSSSAQTIANLPSGVVSGSGQVISLLPSGTVSGSIQVDVMSTTNIARLATTGSNTFTSNQTIGTVSTPTSGGNLLSVFGANSATNMQVFTTTNHATFFEANTNSGSIVTRLQSQNASFVGTLTNNSFDIVSNGTTVIRTTGNGNVTLGTTSTGADGLSLDSGRNLSFAEGSGESYVNIFRQRNSAALVMGQGYKRSLTGGFASSFSSGMARAAIAIGYNNGSIAFFSDPSSTVANGTDIGPTEKMTLTNNGFFGINNTTPITQLDVRLTATDNVNGSVANSYPVASFIVNGSGGGQRGIQLGGPVGSINSPTFLKIFGTSARFSIINQSNVENLTVSENGNMGIGVNSPESGIQIEKSGTKFDSDNQYNQPSGNVFLSISNVVANQDNWFGIRGSYNSSSGSSNLLLQANYRDVNSQAGHYISSKATSFGVADFIIGKLVTSTSVSTSPTLVPQLTILSSGAATFSSSVTASGTLTGGGTNYLVNISTGTNPTYQRILTTGGDVIFGIASSTGSSLLPGVGNYATVLYNNTNTDISFGTNQLLRMNVTSTGYVYLGKGWGASNHRINLEVAQGNNILVVSAYSGSNNDSVIITGAAGANPNAAGAVMYVTTNSSTGRSISAGGTINASGNDYAEYMLKATTDTINKGDIVGVNIDGKLTNLFDDAISFVVKSTDPSYVGGDAWGNIVGKRPERTTDQTEEEFAPILADFESRLEIERVKVDRIAFSGQVPINVTGATVGDYIIPILTQDGKISGQAITNPSFEQYKISVGKVWKIMEDGRAFIAIKIG